MENLIKYWGENGEKLHTLKANSSAIEKLTLESQTFLINCGFPLEAPPCLSFDLIVENKLQSPNQLFGIDYEELDDFLTLGSNGSGDPICIDLSNGEQIVYLNHDNGFESIFINTDIRKFANSLTVYRDFLFSLLSQDIYDFSRRKFSNEEFEDVKTKFLEIDIEALRDRSFWICELNVLLWERNNE